MQQLTKLVNLVLERGNDENFLKFTHVFEKIVAKVLSIALLIVILLSLVDLIVFLTQELLTEAKLFFDTTLIQIFGLFLNILIALELLENITAYLKKHIVQVELVIVTSLIAVARKIIIFDFQKYDSQDMIALALAIMALSISYWLIKYNKKDT